MIKETYTFQTKSVSTKCINSLHTNSNLDNSYHVRRTSSKYEDGLVYLNHLNFHVNILHCIINLAQGY